QSAQDKASANVLFDEGKRLIHEGRPAEACPKFEAALRLAQTLGTKLNLADCYRRVGRTASAWVGFRGAASMAMLARDEREGFARERVAELERSLARLTIRLSPGADVAGLAIRRDGSPVDAALLGAGVPVDPGAHVVEAAAPGRTNWSSKVTVGD